MPYMQGSGPEPAHIYAHQHTRTTASLPAGRMDQPRPFQVPRPQEEYLSAQPLMDSLLLLVFLGHVKNRATVQAKQRTPTGHGQGENSKKSCPPPEEFE